MPVYICKHYRRSTPGARTGMVVDEIRFEAESAVKAETRIRQGFCAPIMPAMDWNKGFATLEDENGQILVTWLHGFLHS
ncbi:MAG TPA: hypothetical protein VMO78_10195 [Rhizomicrobium sp.]|nr:hypothetical protein [Rhizomicrobium sp.]